MKEFLKILELYEKIDQIRLKAALATVICVEGSSYRRPGARMLITSDGKWEGAISGGCLEGDVLRKARHVMEYGKPDVLTYNTMDDAADVFGIRLGCNGIIKILLEPINFSDPENPVLVLKTLAEISEPAVLVSILNTDNIKRQHIVYQPGHENDVPGQIRKGCEAALREGKSFLKVYESAGIVVEAFFEVVQPQMQLLVFGAGYDVDPLINLARLMGWRVTLTDACQVQLLTRQRSCADAILCGNGEDILKGIRITQHTAAVLISHNYHNDISTLKSLINTDIPYIGILGPQKRFQKMRDELEAAGSALSQPDMDRIFAPIGLDIGAETPEEIALSIIGEIKAVFAGRSGQLLRQRHGPIHEREMAYTLK